MKEYQSLSHARWDCKYLVVYIPKCRRKLLYGHIRRELVAIFRELASHKACEIVEGHLMRDHVHMCICASVSPRNIRYRARRVT